jgi:hypothetical protein
MRHLEQVSHPSLLATPYYRIDLPKIPQEYESETLLTVLPGSPLPLRREVDRFAYYFRREFHYDFVQFDAGKAAASDLECYSFDSDSSYTAYLFADCEERAETNGGMFWVGAGCFRIRQYENLDNLPVEVFDWAWIHPYFRSRGILSSHWKRLRRRHGDFLMWQTPFSPTVRKFALQNQKDSIWYPIYEGKEPDWAAIRAKLQAASSAVTQPV